MIGSESILYPPVIRELDAGLVQLLNHAASQHSLAANAVSLFGSTLAYVAVAAMAVVLIVPQVFAGRARSHTVRLVIAVALSAGLFSRFVAKEAIVAFYIRARPFDVVNNVTPLLSHDSVASFPSGHALFFFSAATVLFMFNRRWGLMLYLVAILMGVSRVAGAIHWPTDVAGGALLGMAIGWLAVMTVRRTILRRDGAALNPLR